MGRVGKRALGSGITQVLLGSLGSELSMDPTLVQGICEEILKSQLFSDCSALVDISSYLEACRQDLCLCESPDLSSCICQTVAEYSRQCAHAGGKPQDWRGPNLCCKCPQPLSPPSEHPPAGKWDLA